MISKDRNILLADDSPFYRQKISDMLLRNGHKVRSAKNGREAIEEIKKDPDGIDLLILDLQMPDVDGFGVLRWIGENGYRGRFPVLTVTSIYDPTFVMADLKNLGATGFMQKDLPADYLIFNINKLLDSDNKAIGWIEKGRIPVYLTAAFSIKDMRHQGYLINISESGALLQTKTELTGANLTLEFSLDGQERVLKPAGQIRWYTRTEEDAKRLYWYGIMFTSVSAEDQAILRYFVNCETGKLGDTGESFQPHIKQ